VVCIPGFLTFVIDPVLLGARAARREHGVGALHTKRFSLKNALPAVELLYSEKYFLTH
jgi:hypothetical protein